MDCKPVSWKSIFRSSFCWLVLAIFIVTSCKKDISYPDTRIIGHGATGLSTLNAVYEDNTKEAAEMALETLGCDGIEIDIQASASGKLWLYHDQQLSSRTKSSGCIGTKTDPELEQLHYQSIHKEKLLPLSQLPLTKCAGKTIMLDLRHYDYCKEQLVDPQPFIDGIAGIPAFHDGSIEVLILLNNADWISYFENSSLPVMYSATTFEDAEQVMQQHPAYNGIIIRNAEITKDQVSAMKAAGKKVIIFEVRSPKGIRSAFKKHPDFLVTDDLRATIIEKY